MDFRRFLSSIIGISFLAGPITFVIISWIIMLVKRSRLHQNPPKNLSALRRQLRRESWLTEAYRVYRCPWTNPREAPSLFRGRDWEKKCDIWDLVQFDRKIENGEEAPRPLMETDLGSMYWKRYIDAYQAEHFGSLPYTSWKCFCGRVHPNKIPTCECGINLCKKSTSETWHCSCGRDNPHYTSTCVCGKNKREEER